MKLLDEIFLEVWFLRVCFGVLTVAELQCDWL